MNIHQRPRGIGQFVSAWWTRITRGKHAHVIDHVQERSEAFNQTLMERRLKQTAHSLVGDAHNMVPDRWHTIMLGEIFSFAARARSPERAIELSDKAWGVLQEVAERFAKDTKQLSESDLEIMKSFLAEGESPANVSIATLFERKQAHTQAGDNLRVAHLKATGGSTTKQ